MHYSSVWVCSKCGWEWPCSNNGEPFTVCSNWCSGQRTMTNSANIGVV